MDSFSIEQLSYSVVLILGGLGALFHVIQRSRCVKIRCCGIECDREVPPIDDEETGIESTLPRAPM